MLRISWSHPIARMILTNLGNRRSIREANAAVEESIVIDNAQRF